MKTNFFFKDKITPVEKDIDKIIQLNQKIIYKNKKYYVYQTNVISQLENCIITMREIGMYQNIFCEEVV